jgi:DNA invertase Pin-like site-specific DNA recombinase
MQLIYGYVRVSTKEQKEDRQIIAMEGCELTVDKIFTDKESGKDFERTQYKKMIKQIRSGDTIIIKSIDRLGRNYNEILEQWRYITKTKNTDIVVLDMPLLDTTRSKDLIGTLISDLVLQLLSYIAENERVNIKQRQAEGIEAAKNRGVRFGREQQYNPMDYINIYELTAKKKLSVKQAIEQMGVSESTYFRIKRKLKQLGLGDSEKLSQSILYDSFDLGEIFC